MTEYKVIRYDGARSFPNGTFPTRAEAERHAEHVRSFHGSDKGDVKVVPIQGPGDPAGADDAGSQ